MPRLSSVMAGRPLWSMHHRPSMQAKSFTDMLLAKAVIYKEVLGAKSC